MQGSNLRLLCLLRWQAGSLTLSHLGRTRFLFSVSQIPSQVEEGVDCVGLLSGGCKEESTSQAYSGCWQNSVPCNGKAVVIVSLLVVSLGLLLTSRGHTLLPPSVPVNRSSITSNPYILWTSNFFSYLLEKTPVLESIIIRLDIPGWSFFFHIR